MQRTKKSLDINGDIENRNHSFIFKAGISLTKHHKKHHHHKDKPTTTVRYSDVQEIEKTTAPNDNEINYQQQVVYTKINMLHMSYFTIHKTVYLFLECARRCQYS